MLKKCLLAGEYVRTLVFAHEMNPAPGTAQRAAGETTLSKRSWKQKWEDCKKFFSQKDLELPGSKSMLKRAWALEQRLKERTSKSHAKCDICSRIDSELFKLSGQKGLASDMERKRLRKKFEAHEKNHLDDRAILDAAGFKAMYDPHAIWTLLCDAATENTYLLPRFIRRPKCFGTRPFFKQKLMSVR